MKKGFLLLVPWLPTRVGGVSEAVLGKAQALQASSHYQPYIGVVSWGPTCVPGSIRGIPVVNVQIHDGYGKGLPLTLKSFLHLPFDIWNFLNVNRRLKVDIIDSEFPGIGTVLVPALMRLLNLYDGRIVLVFHGSDLAVVEGSAALARSLWSRLLRGVDMVFACSRALADRVRNFSPQAKVHILPNGVNAEEFLDRRPLSGTVNKRIKQILHVGKFHHQKAQDVALAAFQILLDQGLECRLTLIGAEGPMLEQVSRDVVRFGEKVSLFTNVPHAEIPRYMAEADVFILPSRAEAFGIVLLEAAVAGVPVAASAVGGIPELVEDGRTGLLVPSDDPQSLAEAVRKILTDAHLATALSAAAREKAMNFTWARSVEELLLALKCT